jgi:alkanesulfonate monooxygenase SsuD/methylene tetrahydromethanopterin reductase-like flavin-dependent oxidoreductase (luciferase family)
MKLYMMHLMPYADLDLDYDKTHNSAWITLPNSSDDPKNGAKLYNRYLDELEYADQLGFDGVCVNEHHQNAYGLMPQPGVMAGALARRTKNVKIAILGRALPLLNNPVTVAEEFAMLDCISGGRLVAGFPVGTSMDTNYAYGEVPTTLREKYYEGVRLIMEAWKRNDVFAFNGPLVAGQVIRLSGILANGQDLTYTVVAEDLTFTTGGKSESESPR